MDRRIDDLHILRAVFTMGIVLGHISRDDLVGYGKKIFSVGTTGVAFFFVLSGFLVIYTYKPAKCSVYLKKKFLRIFPLLWICILVTVLLNGIFLKYQGWAFTNWTDIDFMMVVKSLFCVPIIEHSNEIVIPPAWTLSYEVLFYLAGIMLILAGEKMFLLLLSAWIVLIGAGSFADYHFFVLNPLFLELIMGVAVAYIVKGNLIKSENILSVCRGGGIFLFTAALVSETEIIHLTCIASLPHWIKYGIPAALIVLGSTGCTPLLKPSNIIFKILSVIADHSYSIYLTHYITIRFMQLFFRAFTNSSIVLGKGFRFFIIFIMCIIYGITTDNLIKEYCSVLLKKSQSVHHNTRANNK